LSLPIFAAVRQRTFVRDHPARWRYAFAKSARASSNVVDVPDWKRRLTRKPGRLHASVGLGEGDLFAETPRKADYAWTTLARIMLFAKDRGMIATNPCEKGGRLYAADRTDKFWGAAEIAALLSDASPEMALALVLAPWTGQRQGDLLRLSWS